MESDKGWRPVPGTFRGYHCEGTNCEKPIEYCPYNAEKGLILCETCRKRRVERLIAEEMQLAD